LGALVGGDIVPRVNVVGRRRRRERKMGKTRCLRSGEVRSSLSPKPVCPENSRQAINSSAKGNYTSGYLPDIPTYLLGKFNL